MTQNQNPQRPDQSSTDKDQQNTRPDQAKPLDPKTDTQHAERQDKTNNDREDKALQK